MNTTLPFSTNTYFASGYGECTAKAQGFIKKQFFICLTLLCGTAFYATAQQPTISYSGPQTYTVGTAIGTLTPISNGVAAQAYNAAPDSLGSGFNSPRSVAVDRSGNVYVADYGNGAVYEIPAGNGTPITLGSGFSHPSGVAVDAHGNLYVADFWTGITEIPVGNGTPITYVSGFHATSIAVDAAGNIYFIDGFHSSLREIPAGSNGTAVTLGSFTSARDVAVDAAGNVYVTDLSDGYAAAVYEIPAGTGTPITLSSGFSDPTGVAVDAAGNVYVADPGSAALYEIPAGNGTPVALGGNSFLTPSGITIDAKGIVYVADEGYAKIFTISPNGGYYIGPFLPAGLIIDSNTGIISGTPTAASPATNYTVTAYNSAGSNAATVNIAVKAISTDALLANLTISNGNLTPGFSAGTLTYTDAIANFTSGITVVPTTDDPNATITVDGNPATSGVRTSSIPMAVGANTLTIVVTAQDGVTTQTYTITVTRSLPSNALLSSITLSPAATLAGTTGTGYYNFIAPVANTVSSVQVLPTAQDGLATITVDGQPVASGSLSQSIPLNVGSTTITTVVTAEDGVTTKTAIITVNRVGASNAGLANMTINSGAILPAFVTSTTGYVASVPYTTSTVMLTPTTSDVNATVMVNGVTVTSGSASGSIPLTTGKNLILVKVTAQNGVTTKTYGVNITRAAPSTNALYTSIALSPYIRLIGTTGPAYLNFKVTVPNSEATVQVIVAAKDANATITVNSSPVASGVASSPIALNVGANTITILITAQDGVTTKTAIITVTRAGTPTVDYNVYQPVSVTKPTDVVTLEDGITVHQGVSPNGDGINDYLTIDNITNYPDNKLIIVDKNGVMVYQAKGYNNSSKLFDGHSNINGKMQLPGTYFYSLDYAVNGQSKHKTGYIILKY